MIWVGDLEADGLLDTATCIWVGVFLSYPDKQEKVFLDIGEMVEWMEGKTIAFHNGAGYDRELIKKLYGVDNFQLIDTLKLSQMMYPHRQSHSIEAWGNEIGIQKPEHEDWSKYSDDMLHRCKEDVKIGWHILDKAMKKWRKVK